MAKKIDWITIKNEYVNAKPKVSYRDLAEKYGVSKSQIGKTAAKENWQGLRIQQWDKIGTKVGQKTAEIIINSEVNRVQNMLALTDKAQEQIGMALGQLNKYKDMFGKVHDCEIIDVDRLKKLVGALKDIKSIIREDKENENKDVIAKLDSVLDGIDEVMDSE